MTKVNSFPSLVSKTSPVEFQKFISSLHLGERQVVLIPIESNGKRPMVSAGESWKDPKYHLTIAQAIKRLEEGGNIGVVANDWLVIVDLDNPEKYTFPKTTLTVKTRNGRLHKFYVNDGSVVNAVGKNSLAKCGEVRAEWQYVVAAGSYVPADNSEGTGLYTVIDDSPLATLSQSELPNDFIPTNQELPAALPKEILTAVYCDKNKYGWTLDDIRQRDKKLDDLLDGGLAGLPSQSEADMSIITRLLFWEYNEGEAVSILKKFCYRPKLERQDYIIGVLGSITRKEQISNKVNIKTWHPTTGYNFNMQFDKILELDYLITNYVKGIEIDLTYSEADGKKGTVTKALSPKAACEEILKNPQIRVETDVTSDAMYTYTPNVGIYTPYGEPVLEALISNGYGNLARRANVAETLYFIKVASRNNKEISAKVACENGILNITADNANVDPFTPDEFITSKISVAFDKNAKNPNWETFIKKSCPNGHLTLQEWFGYCLLKKYSVHKMMFLYGTTGREGKGTTIRTIENILGDENTSSIPLEPLCERKPFTVLQLKNKLINTSPEPKTNKPLPPEFLKSATGEDKVDADEKYVQNTTKMRNTAKMTVMCNRMPTFSNPDPALIRRLLVCIFPNPVPVGQEIPNIEKTWLETEEMRSGVLNWMIAGLQRLMQNNWQFTLPSDMPDLAGLFENTLQSARKFIEDKIEEDLGSYILKDDLTKRYKDYCRDILKVVPNTNLSDELKAIFYGIKTSRKWITTDDGPTHPHVWTGIRYISDEPPTEQQTLDAKSKKSFETPGTSGTSGTKPATVPTVPSVPAISETITENTKPSPTSIHNQPTPPEQAMGLTPKNIDGVTYDSYSELKKTEPPLIPINCERCTHYKNIFCPHKRTFPDDDNYPDSNWFNDCKYRLGGVK